MKGLFLLLRKLGFNLIAIGIHGWVIIVSVPRAERCERTVVGALERYSFRTDPIASLEISRW
jgi:hypothetical protein